MKVVHPSKTAEQKTLSVKKIERQRLIDDLVIKITLENNARVRSIRESIIKASALD